MKNLLFCCLLAFSVHLVAQESVHCGSDVAMRKFFNAHPGAEAKKRSELANRTVQMQQKTSSVTASYVIPVVFHILHLGGPENVSDAQIIDAVRILNRDFAKQNPDTIEIIPEFKNIADSAGIQFVLAGKDPAGICTNGIIHHYDSDTDWNDNSPSLFSYTWDPSRYMNVYIVRSITLGNGFPAAGYTYYPGTWPTGDALDAIVVLNNYMGSIGTSSSFLSRVLTHEVGHWLGLAHIFGFSQTAGIDCTDDDFVNDTPPTIGYLVCPNPLVQSQYQTCTAGISENYQNYMDYSYCVRMFTKDQCSAMQQTLQDFTSGRDNLVSTANLMSTGVINPGAPCVPIADFKYNRKKTCAGVPVTFTDDSWNGTPTAYNWSFPGGTPASSTFSAPVVTYANPGVYSVNYASSNTSGNSTTVTKTNIISVSGNTAMYPGSWTEGFENNTSFNTDWSVESSSGSGLWERSNTAAYGSAFSVMISRLYNTRKNKSVMTGPSVDLSGLSNPLLTFRVAAAESVPHTNFLKVYASPDCGISWTQIYSRSSSQLVTTNSNVQNFVPLSLADWRLEAVSLSAIQPAGLVMFKFEYQRDTIASANNIFIDNINIGNGVVALNDLQNIQAEISVYPVPATSEVSVAFNTPVKQKVVFSWYDLLGRQEGPPVEKEFEPGEQIFLFGLQGKSPGIYLLKIEMNGLVVCKKIVVGD